MRQHKPEVKYSRLYRTTPERPEYLIFSEDPKVIQQLQNDPDCELVTWIDGTKAARFQTSFETWREAKRYFRRLTGWLGIRMNLGTTVAAFTYYPRISFRKSG